jgi:hypothetical protein
MLLNERQRNISRLLRSGIVQMGDFNSDTDMINWGKQFVTKIFEHCTTSESIKFVGKHSSEGM